MKVLPNINYECDYCGCQFVITKTDGIAKRVGKIADYVNCPNCGCPRINQKEGI